MKKKLDVIFQKVRNKNVGWHCVKDVMKQIHRRYVMILLKDAKRNLNSIDLKIVYVRNLKMTLVQDFKCSQNFEQNLRYKRNIVR